MLAKTGTAAAWLQRCEEMGCAQGRCLRQSGDGRNRKMQTPTCFGFALLDVICEYRSP
jgi:hypothetical protein